MWAKLAYNATRGTTRRERELDAVDTVRLELLSGYRFRVAFGPENVADLTTDVAAPVGEGSGPDSEMLLVAAVANCLSSSLAFSLRKYRNEALHITATADATLSRNAQGRLRMEGIQVKLRLGEAAQNFRLLDRALAQYEDFCVVTQSVRAAIPVTVQVFDGEGQLLTG